MTFNKVFRFLLFWPIIFIAWQILLGDLGADPAKTLNHWTGQLSLYLLLLNIGIGILIAFRFRWPKAVSFLITERRWLGVLTFFYVCSHLGFYLLLEGFEAKAWVQIWTKKYLVFASLAWFILFLLAITSNQISRTKLGAKTWKYLHRLVFLALILITAHVLSIEKTDLVWFGTIFLTIWLTLLFRWTFLPVWQRQKAQQKI
jgi:sulfoxide reductase heme-binding subunit YedZ